MSGQGLLIIDDNADLRFLYTEALKVLSCTNWVFGTGGEALEHLRSAGTLPKTILVDMLMPHMNGEEFIRLLRGDQRFDKINVIITSGLDSVSQHYKEFRADGFLRKPVGIADLERLCQA